MLYENEEDPRAILADVRGIKHPYHPLGCDQQGRYPEKLELPAEAATELGADDEPPVEPLSDGERIALLMVLWVSGMASMCFVGWLVGSLTK